MKKSLFSLKVIEIVSGIKRGETMTYKEVAVRAGKRGASRAVGNILNKHYRECIRKNHKIIPCHRVVRSDGRPGGYVKGEKEKRKMLKREREL
jgi:O-6-methylguanine DNA methyltransferase